MKLVIDVGNTNIKFALFDNHKLKQIKIVATNKYMKLPVFKNITTCIIGSVVPNINKTIANDIYRRYHFHPTIASIKNFDGEFDLSSFNKQEIGLDILAFALAIKKTYQKGVGICFGTATFAVAVSKKTIYGVAITPSFDIALQTIFKKTALIKKTKVELINFKLGKNTSESLKSGVAHNVNGFINSVASYCQETYRLSNVYIDGGKTKWVKFSNKIQHFDNAVLIGYDLINY